MNGSATASLAFSDRFLAQLRSMDKRHYAEVQRMVERFHANSRSHALDLEHYNGSIDPRFRTMRASQAVRAIAWALDGGVYLLDEVVYNHADAERAARNRRCQLGLATGSVRIVRVEDAVEAVAPQSSAMADGITSLFSQEAAKDLRRTMTNDDVRQVVSSFTTVDQLDALSRLIPGYARELQVAYMIASGYSAEEAYAEIAAADSGGNPLANRTEIHIVRSEAELQAVFSQPLLAWRTFLHRSQADLVRRVRFNGPTRVIGGPGTGKTVVAVHRARFLAQSQREARRRRGVLLTAFSRTLAESMQECLEQLLDGEPPHGMKVANIDAIVAQLAVEMDLPPVEILDDPQLNARLGDAIQRAGTAVSPTQLRLEWEDSVLAHAAWTEEAYLAVRRTGAGRAMPAAERRSMWRAIRSLLDILDERGEATHLSRAGALLQELSVRPRAFFDHAVIDESQDLHPVHWRILRAIVPEGPNDLFLVGDVNQQIYRRPFSLASCGIATRGRVRRLAINYRTSAGIVTWARRIVEGPHRADPDGTDSTLGNYVSLIDGPLPELTGCLTLEEEQRAVVARVQGWLAQGIEPEAIAVICRDNRQCERYAKALAASRIRVASGSQAARKASDAVSVITMHRSKGLEFRAVAIPEISEEKFPASPPRSFVEEGDVGIQLWEEQERNLLFVACTRARELLHVTWTGAPSRMLPP